MTILMVGFNTAMAGAYAASQGWTLTGYDGAGHPRYATATGEPVVFMQGAYVGETTQLAGVTASQVIYGPLAVETPVNSLIQATTSNLVAAAVPMTTASSASTKIKAPSPPNLKT